MQVDFAKAITSCLRIPESADDILISNRVVQRKIQRMRMVTRRVRGLFRRFREHFPALQKTRLAWGTSKKKLAILYTRQNKMTLSRNLILQQYNGLYTVSSLQVEQMVLHHIAHLGLESHYCGEHKYDWFLLARALGVREFHSCNAVHYR